MAFQNIFLSCPTDCNSALSIGALDTDQDCTNYTQSDSQVSGIVIKPNTASVVPLTWATASPWAATVVSGAILNSSVDGTKSKYLVGMGGIAAPQEVVVDYPKGKQKVTDYIYTLTLKVLNLTQTQYNTLRGFQCGGTSFVFWYESKGGYIYGGANGIIPKSIKAIFPKGAGNTDKDECEITITWSADGDPDRNSSPFR